jgi:FAD-dependent urate hydroxylase
LAFFMEKQTTAIIGAGPYGLSIAAHLKARGIPIHIFGKPMSFWQQMPPAMNLKSSWSALNISDPTGNYSLNNYSKFADIPWQEPVPLKVFLGYGRWFQQHVVPDMDQTVVTSLTHDHKGFQLALEDGRSISADRVVVATGIASFARIPEYAAHLPPSVVSHSQGHADFSPFKDKRVVVVGSGQSALESAALLTEAGANTELIARGPVLWINRKLYLNTGPIKRLFYPPSDVGPPGINWLVAYPLLFSRFSDAIRRILDERAVRPAGAPWLRPRVEGRVKMTPDTSIVKATQQGEKLHLQLSDGSERTIDHLLLATGYQADIRKLSFIDPSIIAKVRENHGAPLLNKWFESSVPRLHFTGALAGYTFGPLCRFVVGSKVAAQQIERRAVMD